MSQINLSRKRDFGDLFQDSFQYTFQNAKTLIVPLLIWVAPIAIVIGFANAYYSQDLMDNLLKGLQGGDFGSLVENLAAGNQLMPFWVFPLIFLGSLAQIALTGAFVYSHMKAYMRASHALEDQTSLRENAFSVVGLLVGGLLVMFGVGVLAMLAYMLIIAISSLLGTFGIVIGAMLSVCGMIYVFVPMFLLFATQVFEDGGPVQSLKRVYKLVRGNWWVTFGLQFLISLVTGMVNWVLLLTIGMAGTMGTVALLMSQIIIGGAGVVLSAPLWVSMGLQYLNITDQGTADAYLDNVIDQIGDE